MKKLLIALMLVASVAQAQQFGTMGFGGLPPKSQLKAKDASVPVVVNPPAPAKEPYFAAVGSKRLGVITMQSAVLPVKGPLNNSIASLDVVVVGHSTTSWSLTDYLPEPIRDRVAPEAWGVVAGCGGNSVNLTCTTRVAANVGPQIASLALGKLGTQTSPTAKAISQALTDGLQISSGATLGFAVGYGLGSAPIQNGTFQSFKEMFPARGFVANLRDSQYVSFSSTIRFTP